MKPANFVDKHTPQSAMRMRESMVKILDEVTKHTIPIEEIERAVREKDESFTFVADKDEFNKLNSQLKDDNYMCAAAASMLKNAKFYMKSEAYEKEVDGRVCYPDSKVRETGFTINLKEAMSDFLYTKFRLESINFSKYSEMLKEKHEIDNLGWDYDSSYEAANNNFINRYGYLLSQYHQDISDTRAEIPTTEYVYLRDKETDDIIEGTTRKRSDVTYEFSKNSCYNEKWNNARDFYDYAWPRSNMPIDVETQMDKIDALSNVLYEFIAYPPSEIKKALIENINEQSLELPLCCNTLATYYTLGRQVQQANHEMEKTAAALIAKNGNFLRDVVKKEFPSEKKVGETSFVINPQRILNEFDRMKELLDSDRQFISRLAFDFNVMKCDYKYDVLSQEYETGSYEIGSTFDRKTAMISINQQAEEREKQELLTIVGENKDTLLTEAKISIDWKDKALGEMILNELTSNPKYEFAHKYEEDNDPQKIQMEIVNNHEFAIYLENMNASEYNELQNTIDAIVQEYQEKGWETCAEEYIEKVELPINLAEYLKEDYNQRMAEYEAMKNMYRDDYDDYDEWD